MVAFALRRESFALPAPPRPPRSRAPRCAIWSAAGKCTRPRETVNFVNFVPFRTAAPAALAPVWTAEEGRDPPRFRVPVVTVVTFATVRIGGRPAPPPSAPPPRAPASRGGDRADGRCRLCRFRPRLPAAGLPLAIPGRRGGIGAAVRTLGPFAACGRARPPWRAPRHGRRLPASLDFVTLSAARPPPPPWPARRR